MNEIETNDVVETIETTDLLDEITDEELADLVEETVVVELTIEQIVDRLIEASGKTEFTMYAVHTILNGTLEAIDAMKDGDAYRVRPQMVYNYNRGKMVVPKQQVELANVAQVRAFVIKFASKFAK